MNVCVTGAAGFIGGHLVKYLKDMGYWVRGVDIRHPEFESSEADEFKILDLRDIHAAREALEGIDIVYNLAASMGGIGFITKYHAKCASDNTLIDLNMLNASMEKRSWRFFFSSSACVYNTLIQSHPQSLALREDDAWPAEPEEGYGLSKLYTEKLCEYFNQDYNLDVRIARFHNVYGPIGTYEGGREKAPAALCRKVALAQNGTEITIWGDGQQTRSFLYIDDCIEGIYRIMHSNHAEPINLGSDRLVTIEELARMIINISGKDLGMVFDTSQAQGVRGRNSDNTLLKEVTGWEPQTPLEIGLEKTYDWIRRKVGK